MSADGLTDFGHVTPAGFVAPESLAWDDLEPLGTVSGRPLRTHRPTGREVELGPLLQAFELDNPTRPPEVRVTREVVYRDPTFGKQVPPVRETQQFRAWIREPGTYAALEASAARTAAAAAARKRSAMPRLIDAASLIPALARQAEQAVTLTASSVDPAMAPLSRAGRMVRTGGRDPVRGLPAIRAWLEARGCQLAESGGRLVLRAKSIDDGTRAVVDVFGEAIVAELVGHPARCAVHPGRGEPPPAYTLAFPSLPVCQSCLEGSDR